MKKKRIKFFEGGDIPDIPREPLRDSSGRRVRSSMDTFTKRFDYNRSIKSPNEDEELEGSDVMSGSTEARQGKKFPETRIESGPKGYLDDDIKPPSEKDDNGIGQRPRPRPPGGPTPVKNVDIDESDRRREEIGKLPQKTRGKPKSTNASEAPGSTDVERPYGAFRGNRSDTETDANKRSRGAFRGIRNDSAKDAENKKRGAFRGTRSDSASEMNKRGAFRGTRSDMSQDYFAKGGKVGSASKRADGIAQRGKTRGMMR